VLGVALLFALDAALFRSAFYRRLLEPDSSTGVFELTLERERRAQKAYGDNMAVTLGDSRFAYSPKLSNAITARTGLILRHAGIGGTEWRSAYYMLRDLDPTRRRYRAVVLGVPDFLDHDDFVDPADDLRTLHYVIERLRWTDVLDFAASFHQRPLQWQALRGSLLKGIVLQQDVLAFLSHPAERIRYTHQTHMGYEEWTYDFEEDATSMAGLQVDWHSGKAVFPEGFREEQRITVRAELSKLNAPQTGRMAAYRREWFGRIIDLYRGSRTKVIFVRLPRGPVPRPDELAKPAGSTILDLAASRPNVLAAPEHAFDSLERPELFKDGIHLNRAGIARFSPMVAEEIGRLLSR
jgi:lysophospholipase L1-like esterase